jgi:microcystin-dependent protein
LSEPFIGEVKLVSFNYPPRYWAFCNGQLLSITQNLALFSLLGTQFGGNGSTQFALPDLRGRVPLHRGSGHNIGEAGGSAAVSLNSANLPSHPHLAMASSVNADAPVPASAVLGAVSNTYTQPANLKALTNGTIGTAGSSQPHENRQPYAVVNFCIALFGIFPSRP